MTNYPYRMDNWILYKYSEVNRGHELEFQTIDLKFLIVRHQFIDNTLGIKKYKEN